MKQKIFLLFIFFLSVFPCPAQEKVIYTEKWKPVPDVKKYLLQIAEFENENRIVFQLETDKTTVEVELPPGKYKKRLGLINQKGNVFYYTEWKEFAVYFLPEPKVDAITKISGIGSNVIQYEIKMQGLTDGTKIFLKDRNELIPLSFEKKDKDAILVTLPVRDTGERKYDLLIRNSEKKFTIINLQETEKKLQKPADTEALVLETARRLTPGLVQKETVKKEKGYFLQYGFWLSFLYTSYYYKKLRDYERVQKPSLILHKNNLNLVPVFYAAARLRQDPLLQLYAIYENNNAITITKNYNRDLQYYYAGMTGLSFFLILHAVDIGNTEMPRDREFLAIFWQTSF